MKDNEPIRISASVANLIGFKYDKKHNGIGVRGCGTDVGWEIVYLLSRKLFKDGFMCIGEKCPSNDHYNGDMDYSEHLHKDGGYALNCVWM